MNQVLILALLCIPLLLFFGGDVRPYLIDAFERLASREQAGGVPAAVFEGGDAVPPDEETVEEEPDLPDREETTRRMLVQGDLMFQFFAAQDAAVAHGEVPTE